jgi:hypothetical protein
LRNIFSDAATDSIFSLPIIEQALERDSEERRQRFAD